MASSTPIPTGIAHRTVSNIRSNAGGVHNGPSSPRTPARGVASGFGSPSALRAEEETIVLEVGTRAVRVGFAGDANPKAILRPRPEDHRRVGDFTTWSTYPDTDRSSSQLPEQDRRFAHEIWTTDIRASDLGLVEDRIDRIIREAFNKYLLVDSRPRRMSVVLPSMAPLPLVSIILDLLFNRFQALSISLLSSAVMSTLAAGVRSAVVVDIGWAETTVTSVCEYREINATRSVRGAKLLIEETRLLLEASRQRMSQHTMKQEQHSASTQQDGQPKEASLSFAECEDVSCRMAWCRQAVPARTSQNQRGLSTVEENVEETEDAIAEGSLRIPLMSCEPPDHAIVNIQGFSDVCENTFIASQYDRGSFDDEETPIPELIYQNLLGLSIDARAACMSRIVFTGGCSKIPGLRQRLFTEIESLLWARGWDPVCGKAAEQARHSRAHGVPGQHGGAAVRSEEHDTEQNLSQEPAPPTPTAMGSSEFRGKMRAIETLGPWSGASMAGQLKALSVASIDRDLWAQQGISGASRPTEVDLKVQQRQSLGHGGLIRGASSIATANWTLGAWGAI